MAARKRSRDVADIDGEVETESASSNLRHQPSSKRSRIALAQRNGGSVVSDDEDDNEVDDGHINVDVHLPAEYSEDEDEEIDEIQATQIYHKQSREHRENMASEQGVIEEVFCRNFMCHSKLRIKLGPLINFIIGHNGSGKSAVLTALTMCLGGKAITTNRGASMKNLIKEGEESATLAVKIKNQGDGAYKPELYGSSITVERNFTRSGASGFKIKNSNDKVISTKKQDLLDILDFFAFQLDNPINVLTQDMARQFLSNSSPADKYKFFIRGTQLETLDGDYKLLEEHLDGITEKLHSRNEDIVILKRKMDEADSKKKRLEQHSTIRERIKKLQWEHAWAQVEEQEHERDELLHKVDEAEQAVQEKIEGAGHVDGAYEGHNQTWEAAKRTLADFEQQLVPAKDSHDAEKEKFDANRRALLDLKQQEREIKENRNKSKATVSKLQKEIEAETERLADTGSTQQIERMAKLDELKAECEEATREQMNHGAGSAGLERNRKDAQESLDAAKPELNQHKEAVQRAEQQLQNTIREQPRPYAAYRHNMERFVRAVNNETRWRSKPVGPMGVHVKLLNTEWSSQIEKTFGGALDSFVVTCKEDQNLLSQLMRRMDCHSTIFIGHPDPLDVSDKEPEGVDTILRVLEIDSPLVRNQLIVNQGIDQTVLIADQGEAYRYMYESGPRPLNVKATICQDRNDKRKGLRFEWSRSGGGKSGPILKWEGQPRMKSNREDQIRSHRADVDQAKRDLDAAEKRNRQLIGALEKAKQELVRFVRRQKDLHVEVQRAEEAVIEQQEEIDRHRPQDGKLQELERQVGEAKDGVEADNASFSDMVEAQEKLNGIQDELKRVLDSTKAEHDQATKRIEDAEKRVRKTSLAREEALRKKNEALEMIDFANGEKEKAQRQADNKAALVRDFIAQAEQICRRVNVTMQPAVIDKRLHKLIHDLEMAEKEVGGTREEILLAYQVARKEHQDAKDQLEEMFQCAKMLQATLTNRHYRWKMFRKYISARARVQFGYLLSERQFRGRVLMNHQDKELDIKVEPDLSKSSDAGRATKTLSGGEKSFSTICLLLSIWEAMGSPIRCLDEFDVFMDSVNRATSLSMMIKAARRSVGRQFILITPQSMNNVELGDDVKIHKMSDPERGQGILPFGGTQTS